MSAKQTVFHPSNPFYTPATQSKTETEKEHHIRALLMAIKEIEDTFPSKPRSIEIQNQYDLFTALYISLVI